MDPRVLKIIHKAHLNYQRNRLGGHDVDGLNERVRTGDHRIKGKSEIDHLQQAKLNNPPMSWRLREIRASLFCIHSKLMIEACHKCNRKAKLTPDAAKQLLKALEASLK